MSKILITGADGFIGSHVVETLVKNGRDVRALTLYNSYDSNGWLDNLDVDVFNSIEIISSDIRDPFAMKEIVKGCDIILHLAALIAIPYSYIAPQSYVETNVLGTLNLLQASRDNNIKHFVHTSSSEVYGSAKFVPITEDHPLQPQSPYSASKIGADNMAISYNLSFDLPVSIIRPFNTYGPRQSNRAVIPTIITQILNGQKDIKLGSLYPTRDFNFVLDTACAYNKICDNLSRVGEVTNIGSQFEISIKDVTLLIADILGKEINIIEEEKRLRPINSEVDRLLSDSSLAKEFFNWTPKHTGLQGLSRGLEKTIEWFSEPKKPYVL